MSFPHIPDISPCINISLADAVNLLLTSIALEEISLSRLMDAEAAKVLCLLNDCSCRDSPLQDALEVNKSVDTMVQNLIKLQMLLQFKLEKVKDILPATSTCSTSTCSTSTCSTSTCSTSTCSTSTCSTSTCSTSTCSTSTKKECFPCLSGKAKGCISNPCDEFYGQTGLLTAFILASDIRNSAIRYTAEKSGTKLDFWTCGYDIKISCACHSPHKMMLYGKGNIKKAERCHTITAQRARFQLALWQTQLGQLEFEISIIAENRPDLTHRSGCVRVQAYGSTLKI